MAYVAQADIEQYLGITLTSNGQSVVNNLLIPNLSKAVDNYCNRTWTNVQGQTITELFDAGTDTFFIAQPDIDPAYPLTVSVGQVPWSTNYIFNYKTHVRLYTSPQTILLLNPVRFQAVAVTYCSLSYVLPADLKQALVMWIAQEFQKSPDAGREAYSVSTGNVRVEFAASKLNSLNVIPPFVKMVLDNYRLSPIDKF